jgi:RNA polymerase sigma factor (TIGR02999 family)
MKPTDSVTVLLNAWVKGDASALDRLLPLVYPDLHGLARAYLRRGARPVTLQTTAVVNELFVKLLVNPPKRLESRRHFYVLAARVIRMALVDHYRQIAAEKRGGAHQRVPLHDDLAWVDANSADMLSFDRALEELEQIDREQAELFGMRFLLGCTTDETAELTGLSKSTVDRRVRLARAWLFQRLRDSNSAPHTDVK